MDTPKHRGERWEVTRLRRSSCDMLTDVRLPALRPIHVTEWRERRLQAVSGASVRREMNLLQSVLKACHKDWGWLDSDPLDRPANPPSRRRRISQDEVDRITLALGYDGGVQETISDRVALSFLFALETAMRSGEILGLIWAALGQSPCSCPIRRTATPVAYLSVYTGPRDHRPAAGGRTKRFQRGRRHQGRAVPPRPKCHMHPEPALPRLSRRGDLAAIEEAGRNGVGQDDRPPRPQEPDVLLQRSP